MRLEPGEISRNQATYLLCVAVLGTAITTAPHSMIAVAKQDAWLLGLVSGVYSLVPSFLWLTATAPWPRKDLFEVTLAAAGPLLGTAINLLLLGWLLSLVSVVTWQGAAILIDNFLPSTPWPVVVGSLLLPAALAVRGGLEVTARLAQLVFWGLVTTIGALGLLLVFEFDVDRLQPVLARGFTPIAGGALTLGWIFESMMLVAVLPFVARRDRSWRLIPALAGIIALAVSTVAFLVVGVFGPALPTRFRFVTLQLTHVIRIGEIIERIDAPLAIVWVTGIVTKVAFWYWLSCLGAARVFGLSNYRPIVRPMGLLVGAMTLAWFRNESEAAEGIRAWSILMLPTIGVAVPLLLLAGRTVRRALGRSSS